AAEAPRGALAAAPRCYTHLLRRTKPANLRAPAGSNLRRSSGATGIPMKPKSLVGSLALAALVAWNAAPAEQPTTPPKPDALTEVASHIPGARPDQLRQRTDRKSTRLNSSHVAISYAVFC